MTIIKFEKKKMILLTNEKHESYLNQINCHSESYLNQVNCHICKKDFEHKHSNDKSYFKVKNHSHLTGKEKRYCT